MKRYPPRYAIKPYRWEDEDTGGRYVRVCPACFRPLRWLHWPKLMRMDQPTPSNEVEDISWSPEYGRYVVPRYIDVSEPHCSEHKRVDWWLIADQHADAKLFPKDTYPLIVGIASDNPTFWPKAKDPETGKMVHQEGGKLFRRPVRFTMRLHRKLLRSRSCRYAGRWKFDGNKTVAPSVTPIGQMRLF